MRRVASAWTTTGQGSPRPPRGLRTVDAAASKPEMGVYSDLSMSARARNPARDVAPLHCQHGSAEAGRSRGAGAPSRFSPSTSTPAAASMSWKLPFSPDWRWDSHARDHDGNVHVSRWYNARGAGGRLGRARTVADGAMAAVACLGAPGRARESAAVVQAHGSDGWSPAGRGHRRALASTLHGAIRSGAPRSPTRPVQAAKPATS